MNRIELTNFRVFANKTAFDLAPITILTGKNNSGKSSLIKAFVLLSDFLQNEEDQLSLNLNGPSAQRHKINKFQNLRNWDAEFLLYDQLNLPVNSDKYLCDKVEIGFTHGDYTFAFVFEGYNEEDTIISLLQVQITIDAIEEKLVMHRRRASNAYEVKVSQTFIDFVTKEETERLLFSDTDYLLQYVEAVNKLEEVKKKIEAAGKKKESSALYIEAIEERQALEKRVQSLKSIVDAKNNAHKGIIYKADVYPFDDEMSRTTIAHIIQSALYKHISSSKDFKFSGADERRTLVKFYEQIKKLMSFGAYHLGTNRTYQSRLYLITGQESEINTAIAEFQQRKPVAGSEADTFLKKWIKRFDLGEDVLVEPVENVASIVTVIKNGHTINLADLGYGAGQLLTILFRITNIINQARGRKSNIVLIEEPEANLHPKLQSMLAELFIDASKAYKLQFILETHSEYLIRKLQVLVAREVIFPEDAVIYYLDSSTQSDSLKDDHVIMFDYSDTGRPDKNIDFVVNGSSPYHNGSSSLAKRIKILPDGKLSDEFGQGFFDEADEQALQLHRIQRKKQPNK